MKKGDERSPGPGFWWSAAWFGSAMLVGHGLIGLWLLLVAEPGPLEVGIRAFLGGVGAASMPFLYTRRARLPHCDFEATARRTRRALGGLRLEFRLRCKQDPKHHVVFVAALDLPEGFGVADGPIPWWRDRVPDVFLRAFDEDEERP